MQFLNSLRISPPWRACLLCALVWIEYPRSAAATSPRSRKGRPPTKRCTRRGPLMAASGRSTSPATSTPFSAWARGMRAEANSSPHRSAARLARVQSGYVYHYAFVMLLGVAGLLAEGETASGTDTAPASPSAPPASGTVGSSTSATWLASLRLSPSVTDPCG